MTGAGSSLPGLAEAVMTAPLLRWAQCPISAKSSWLHEDRTLHAVLQHREGNSQCGFSLAFLLTLLCSSHQCISMLRHRVCQLTSKGFSVSRFARLQNVVYPRNYLR